MHFLFKFLVCTPHLASASPVVCFFDREFQFRFHVQNVFKKLKIDCGSVTKFFSPFPSKSDQSHLMEIPFNLEPLKLAILDLIRKIKEENNSSKVPIAVLIEDVGMVLDLKSGSIGLLMDFIRRIDANLSEEDLLLVSYLTDVDFGDEESEKSMFRNHLDHLAEFVLTTSSLGSGIVSSELEGQIIVRRGGGGGGGHFSKSSSSASRTLGSRYLPGEAYLFRWDDFNGMILTPRSQS